MVKSILVAMLTVLVSSEPAAAGWVTERVRHVGDVGSWSSLAVFSSPNNLSSVLHVSYYNATSGNLQYAQKISGQGWTSHTVASRGDVGESNALALGRRATYAVEPRIAYHDVTRGTISYAYHSADRGWRIDSLRRQWFADGGFSPSMVIDSEDRYHIIHEDHTGRTNLRYVTSPSRRGPGWDVGVLGVQIQEQSSALAIAGDDTLHVVYLDYCPLPFFDCDHRGVVPTVVHASNTGLNGVWETENITTVEVDGIMGSSIGVDAQGAVHIVYVDRHDLTLNYLTNASGQWTAQVVDDRGAFGASMKLDSGDHLHISYVAREGSHGTKLRYATNKSGAWVTEAVDGASAIGNVTSIVIDRFAQPNISYYDATARNLRHAVRTLQ